MISKLNQLEPVCQAIRMLAPDLFEIVLHDLTTGKIAFIANTFSPRKIGDDSLVETENYQNELNTNGTIGPYMKSNSDGSKVKSVSAAIRGDDGAPIGLLCINMRTTGLEVAAEMLAGLIATDASKGDAILKNDWRELANTIIAHTLDDLKISFNQLKRSDRLIIVQNLHDADIFDARGAADYTAEALGISRANLYTLLQTARQPAEAAPGSR